MASFEPFQSQAIAAFRHRFPVPGKSFGSLPFAGSVVRAKRAFDATAHHIGRGKFA